MFARRVSSSLLARLSRPCILTPSPRFGFRALSTPTNPQPPSPSPPLLQPRQFPTTGFQVIDSAERVEEEALPCFEPNEYYPMTIGDVVHDKYQIVGKLGCGVTSTVWLARDLTSTVDRRYWTLKVHINADPFEHERDVFWHLEGKTAQEAAEKEVHPGRQYVRRLEDEFLLQGPHGDHTVLVFQPLGMSLKTFQGMQETGVFDAQPVKAVVDHVLLGLDFLYGAGVVHTDLHADNLLIGLTDEAVLAELEEDEMTNPSMRKLDDDGNATHVSHYVLGGIGPLIINDMGQARIGKNHDVLAMAVQSRAPEVILGMVWGPKVDMWSVGLLAWSLLQKETLFDVYDTGSEENNKAHHLAAMTVLLGPPPKEFLKGSDEAGKYWNDEGNWIGPVPLPPSTSLADRVTFLEGEDKELFVHFLDCCLAWRPEDRVPPLELFGHAWMRGIEFIRECMEREVEQKQKEEQKLNEEQKQK